MVNREKNSEDRRNTEMCGSFTVEAAFLVPFLVFLLLSVVWFSIYLHDRIVIDDVIFQICREGENYLIYCDDPENGELNRQAIHSRGLFYALCSDAGKERYLETLIESRTRGKLFMLQQESVLLQKSGCYIRICARFSCPVPGWIRYIGEGNTGEYYKEYQMFCPVREEITRIGNVILSH